VTAKTAALDDRTTSFLRRAATVLLVICALWGLWEGYKWLWETAGWTWPFAVNSTTMPHLHDVVAAFWQPTTTIGAIARIGTVCEATMYGMIPRSRKRDCDSTTARRKPIVPPSRKPARASLPVNQAAFSSERIRGGPPVVVGLGSKGVAGWKAVAILAAYLTFFPVAINTLRGLHSVDPRAVELMHSYAATRWRVLWRLRVPSSVPYIFTALKISATASVIGAIIGETPASIQSGLGGAIVNFNQYYALEPTFLWATNVVCAILGIIFYLAVAGTERLVLRRAPEHFA